MTIPTTAVAGDTLAWTESLSDYPASSGWTLHYRLVSPASSHTFDATASGSDHAVALAATATAKWAAGDYTLVAWVTKAAERYTISQTPFKVTHNLAQGHAIDTRSSAAIALAAMDAALEAYGSKAWTQSYSVGDRAQSFRSPAEFMAFRSKLQREVAAEAQAARMEAGLAPRNRLLFRFGGNR